MTRVVPSADMVFGKITAEQLLMALQMQPLIESVMSELQEEFLRKPEAVATLAPNGFRWASIYESPIQKHIAMLLLLMEGEAQYLLSALQSNDPYGELLKHAHEASLEETPAPDLNFHLLGERHTFSHYFGWVIALLKSFECVAVYGKYINEYLAESRQGGEKGDEALFRAIRIDPTVITSPTAARRMSTAVAFGEEVFFHKLQRAMEGKTGDQVAYLRRFRLAVKTLAESDGLNQSATTLAKQLIELGIYSNGPTALKNATELIRKSKHSFSI